ncbi:MAG: alkaline phosphatase family protein [Metallosphaera sp.]|uniref:alkaline phosphatase family protein n=1 Tax=Metallosphaera sp. TaxID=2020860 RepID=UPI00316756C7
MSLIFPDYGKNLYSLGCGLAKWLDLQVQCRSHIEIAGNKLVLLLLDGFGWNIMERSLGEVKEANKIHGVFPSTTSTTLATIFTAKTPAEHGVLGYNTFVKSLGGIINTLRYTHPTSNERDSLARGFPFEKAFPNAIGYLSQVKEGTASVIPAGIENTEYTKAIHGHVQETRTFLNVWDAYESTKQLMEKGTKFIYVYIPDVDSLAHKYGPYAEPVILAAREIFMRFFSLFKERKDYVGLITADHGLIGTSNIVEIEKEPELMSMLDVPPYGDSRALFLKSRFDLKVYLENKFNMRVFKRDEAIPLLGGVENPNLPDFIGVPLDYTSYIFSFRESSTYARLKGHHGGLLKEEIEVPLVTVNG